MHSCGGVVEHGTNIARDGAVKIVQQRDKADEDAEEELHQTPPDES